MRHVLAAAVVVAALGAAPVTATASEIDAGAGVGIAAPLSESGYSETSVGFHADAHVVYALGSKLGLRADAFLGLNPYGRTDGGTRLAGLLAGVQYDLPIEGPVAPYALAGLGLVNVHWAEEALTDVIYGPYSATRLGFAGGVGASYDLADVELFAEVRLMVVATKVSATTIVPITVGVRFGVKK